MCKEWREPSKKRSYASRCPYERGEEIRKWNLSRSSKSNLRKDDEVCKLPQHGLVHQERGESPQEVMNFQGHGTQQTSAVEGFMVQVINKSM